MGLRSSFLILLWLSACGSATSATAPSTPHAASLPGVTIAGVDGEHTTLAAVVRGRPALLSLWATWCSACKEEFTPLNKLQDHVGPSAIVLGVAVGERAPDVRRFVAEQGLRYPQLVDEEYALADALGSHRIPTTVVVDARGSVRYSSERLDAAALRAFQQVLRESGQGVAAGSSPVHGPPEHLGTVAQVP